MEWEDHFSCVHRSKIVRRIMTLRDQYDKEKDVKARYTERDNIYFTIMELEDLLR